MYLYDVAVVGAGPAGIMAAIRTAQLKKDIVLIERNNTIGKKILLTGKGRCNISNAANINEFIEAFGKQGSFLRSAFSAFFNNDLIAFFKAEGLVLKTERQGRIFPVTNKASSITDVLKKCLSKEKIKLLYNMRLTDIRRKNTFFELYIKGKKEKVCAKKIVLATGGASYKVTGSSGDGFHIAEKLGHTVIPLKPNLVPLKVKEPWVKKLQGLSLRNIRIEFKYGNKKIRSTIGELIFTHFGVSGPLVLDLSGKIVSLFGDYREILLLVDLKPGLKPEQLEKRLLREFRAKGNALLKNVMKDLLPNRLIPAFLHLGGISPEKKINQISRKERRVLLKLLKALPLTVNGSLPIEEAMVTGGGISMKEIDPRTMESKIVPGLYFAGEIIDGSASSGGYNLQQAFSTGFLAGESV